MDILLKSNLNLFRNLSRSANQVALKQLLPLCWQTDCVSKKFGHLVVCRDRCSWFSRPLSTVTMTEEYDPGQAEGAKGSGDVNVQAKGAGGAKKGRLSVERIYQKKSQLEHILLRPDTYIGSVQPLTEKMWVLDEVLSGL